MPAGPLGGRHRRRLPQGEARPELQPRYSSSGDVSGYGGNSCDVHADRNVTAFYGELNIPLLKTLEANVAIRTDDYSDFGRTNNPKASPALPAEPRRAAARLLRHRASSRRRSTSSSCRRPRASRRGHLGPGALPGDARHRPRLRHAVRVIFGGNPDLQAGGVARRPRSASCSSRPTRCRSRRITSRSASRTCITNGIPSTTILGDLDQFGGLVTRGPVDPELPEPARPHHGNRADVHQPGIAAHRGLSTSKAHYKWPRTSWGRVRFDISGTYYSRYDLQNIDGSVHGLRVERLRARSWRACSRAGSTTRRLTWDSGPVVGHARADRTSRATSTGRRTSTATCAA